MIVARGLGRGDPTTLVASGLGRGVVGSIVYGPANTVDLAQRSAVALVARSAGIQGILKSGEGSVVGIISRPARLDTALTHTIIDTFAAPRLNMGQTGVIATIAQAAAGESDQAGTDLGMTS